MSEVRRLREQIEEEYRAAQQALHGYAITARHDFINARMSCVDEHRLALEDIVGRDQSMAILIEINDRYAPAQKTQQPMYCVRVNDAVAYFGLSQALAEQAWKEATADPGKRVVVLVNGVIQAVREPSPDHAEQRAIG